MSTAVMMKRIGEASPRLRSRIAGVFYLLTILIGVVVLNVHGRLRFAADLIATACYIAVPVLFYGLLKPVNRSLSLLAASFKLVGLAIGKLNLHPQGVDIAMVFHGFYCVLTAYLILRSTFLPRILGAVMVIAGLGWLTFLSQPLAEYLSPWNMAPGGIGEGLLCLWLLVMGVSEQRWKDQPVAGRFDETDPLPRISV